jgi:hypothetical protein
LLEPQDEAMERRRHGAIAFPELVQAESRFSSGFFLGKSHLARSSKVYVYSENALHLKRKFRMKRSISKKEKQ